MSMESVLKAALTPIAPTEADVYEGKSAVYITFNFDTIPDNFGDDEPEHERLLIQVHLYARAGYDTIRTRREIKKALAAAGTTWPRHINASDKNGQHHVFECEAIQEVGE